MTVSAQRTAGETTVSDGHAGADLQLTSVTKNFGAFTAVDDLDLLVEQGRFFALLGPSGCGKTTTLRMVAGLEEPTRGTITIAGRDITRLKPYRRPVNTVFQNYALFPHLDVFENVAFGLRRQGRRHVKQEVQDMLALVELKDMGARKPGQLSGGQQQRVALARALINRPQVLLLDEPLGALDLKLRRQMQIELKAIQHDIEITFIHVTHDQEEAMTMADRIAVMNHGRIEQLGTPSELYETPNTAFVAGFLGVSNLIPGTVASEGTVQLRRGPLVHVSPEVIRGRSGDVAVGIRPEKIELGDGQQNVLSGRVVESAYVGVATQYIVETPCGRITVNVQNARAGSEAAPVGSALTLSWSPEATFVVDSTEEEPA